MKILFAFLLSLSQPCFAQFSFYENDVNDLPVRTEAPYFTTSLGTGSVVLMESTTNIAIDTVIADVQIKQRYKNNGTTPIEATYTFPASAEAAVYGLTIKIEDRIIEAKIQEKGKARETYEQAKQEGKSAALLEQRKPNVFSMNVANILPGELIEVELRYTELLKIADNTYELAYPVGFNSSDPNGNGGLIPPSSIDLSLNTAIPARDIVSPSHNIQVVRSTDNQVAIQVLPEDIVGPADFVLRYRLAGEMIQTGIQLYQGEEENYFLLQMEPPKLYQTSMIANREYIFVIDTSGSMHGFPIEVSKTLLVELLQSLRAEEKFNVVFFSGNFNILSPESLDVTAYNVERVIAMLDGLEGRGSTELLGALNRVSQIPQLENYARSVITVSDGYINIEPEVYDHIERNLSNTNYFSFGIGRSVNRHLMQVIARAGFGDTYIALNEQEAQRQGRALLNTIRYPLLTGIDVDFGEFEVYDIQPLFLPDLFSHQPITITGKWQNSPKGKISIAGVNGLGPWQNQLSLQDAVIVKSKALEYIWARKEIQQLQDRSYIGAQLGQTDSYKNSIIELGLKHNLLTNFTSFVAVDSVARTAAYGADTVKPVIANGFNISAMLFGLTSPIKAQQKSLQESTHTIGKFRFYRSGNHWIDVNHSAAIPVVDIGFSSFLFKKLAKIFPDIATFNKGDVIYITLKNLTLRISDAQVSLDTDKQAKVIEALGQYETP